MLPPLCADAFYGSAYVIQGGGDAAANGQPRLHVVYLQTWAAPI